MGAKNRWYALIQKRGHTALADMEKMMEICMSLRNGGAIDVICPGNSGHDDD
jgi:hypothetical protein